jgi:hypothetical protein
MVPVHFEKQGTDEKAGTLVSIDEGVVADNAGGISSSHAYDVRAIAIGVKLLRPGEGGFQQSFIADACGTAVEGKKTVVKSEDVAFVYPDRLTHLASACSVLR